MKVEIGLPSYPSTGYCWQPDREPDETSYHDTDPQPDDTPPEDLIIGGEIMERFVFDEVPLGTNITFSYLRLWEEDIPPKKIVRVRIEEQESSHE